MLKLAVLLNYPELLGLLVINGFSVNRINVFETDRVFIKNGVEIPIYEVSDIYNIKKTVKEIFISQGIIYRWL